MKQQSFAIALFTSLVASALFFSDGAMAAKSGGTAAGGNWGSGTAISPVNQPDPTRGAQLNDIAVNASGLAVAAWDQYTYNYGGGATIGVAVQSGGRWNAPFTISGATGFSMNPRVAIGADGTMAVSWTYEDPSTSVSPQRKAQVAVKPAGASAWVTATLAQGPIGGVAITQFVPVVVDAKGNVTAAWTTWDGSHSVIQAATRAAGPSGAWSPPTSLAPGVSAMYPALSVDARGDAAVVYSVSSCAGCNMPYVAQYSFRSGPTGSWSIPVNVSEAIVPYGSGYVTSPLVALDANGLATVIYFGYGVEGTRQLAPGNWTSPQTVLAAPNAVSSYGGLDLGLDDGGNAIVAAWIFDASIGVDRSSVYVTRGTPGGGWTIPQRLTDPSVPVDAYATRVAVSPDGSLALVGWIDHYHGTVQVAQLAGGLQSGGSTWSTTTIGRGTAFSSFQEVLGLHAGSGTVARAVWKNAKSGTQTYASSYRR
jgi:hypothetical protein